MYECIIKSLIQAKSKNSFRSENSVNVAINWLVYQKISMIVIILVVQMVLANELCCGAQPMMGILCCVLTNTQTCLKCNMVKTELNLFELLVKCTKYWSMASEPLMVKFPNWQRIGHGLYKYWQTSYLRNISGNPPHWHFLHWVNLIGCNWF